MSVKHAISRGLELGRSAFQLGLLKPAGRLAAKFRGERLRVAQPSRTVQPQTFLPVRYRYYRMSLSGLAAQLQSGGFRRLIGGSPRNRIVFLAFGVGLGLIEQQFEDDRKSVAACQQIQVRSLHWNMVMCAQLMADLTIDDISTVRYWLEVSSYTGIVQEEDVWDAT